LIKIDENILKEIIKTYDLLSSEGFRVLAIARKDIHEIKSTMPKARKAK